MVKYEDPNQKIIEKAGREQRRLESQYLTGKKVLTYTKKLIDKIKVGTPVGQLPILVNRQVKRDEKPNIVIMAHNQPLNPTVNEVLINGESGKRIAEQNDLIQYKTASQLYELLKMANEQLGANWIDTQVDESSPYFIAKEAASSIVAFDIEVTTVDEIEDNLEDAGIELEEIVPGFKGMLVDSEVGKFKDQEVTVNFYIGIADRPKGKKSKPTPDILITCSGGNTGAAVFNMSTGWDIKNGEWKEKKFDSFNHKITNVLDKQSLIDFEKDVNKHKG